MKANAPEKIYLVRTTRIIDEWRKEPSQYGHNIEYIKTDVFIEKAREWLNKESESYVKTGGVGACVTYEGLDVKELVEDFEKYIWKESKL